MASTDTRSAVHWLEALDGAALAQLQALVEASGWNQLDADWRLFFSQGRIAVCHDALGCIVASGAVLPLGEQIAWISMILVRPEARGHGLGGRIFQACLHEARLGGRTACLDATPQGEQLYLHHGFAPTERITRITRWKRDALPEAPATTTMPSGSSVGASSAPALAVLDEQALGAPRAALLSDLLGRPGSRCVRGEQAWALVRKGRVAQHIGPLLAVDDTSAIAVLERTLHGITDPVLIDVPEPRPSVAQALERAGFALQRPFTRMALGDAPPEGQSHYLYAIAGPEYG